jgi:hypothetical protein
MFKLSMLFTEPYEFSLLVFSKDFSPARAKFRLHLGKQINDAKFERVS